MEVLWGMRAGSWVKRDWSLLPTAPLPRSRPVWYLECSTTIKRYTGKPITTNTDTLNFCCWAILKPQWVFREGILLYCSRRTRDSGHEAPFPPTWVVAAHHLPSPYLALCVTSTPPTHHRCRLNRCTLYHTLGLPPPPWEPHHTRLGKL